MRKLLLSLGLALVLSGFADAKTPPEVLKPYKEYRAALKAGDNTRAQKYAYEAWKEAEDRLGDSKIAGDLAYNYATIPIKMFSKSNIKKRVEKAYSRSIELSHFYEDLAADVEIQRHIKLIDFKLSNVKFKKLNYVPDVTKADMYGLKKTIKKHNKLGTTYEAELEALRAQFYHLYGEDDVALMHAERSLELFETRSDTLPSTYPYVAKLFKGKSLDNLGEKIPAALVYQDVMQNLEGNLAADHPFVNHAFSKWMWIRNDIERSGELEEAEAAGLCECWPFNDYKGKALPILRVPPIMPPRAERSGHVIVKFDLSETGLPINITKVSASSEVFVKSALKSVKGWRFSSVEDMLGEDYDPKNRQGIVNTITFRLSDQNGKIIPE